MWNDYGWGFRITHIMGGIIEALIVLTVVLVAAGLVFLLVRFLLVATRAAQLYVSQHEPARIAPAEKGSDAAPATLAPPTTPTTPVPPTAPTTSTAPPAKKATKPKTPPAS